MGPDQSGPAFWDMVSAWPGLMKTLPPRRSPASPADTVWYAPTRDDLSRVRRSFCVAGHQANGSAEAPRFLQPVPDRPFGCHPWLRTSLGSPSAPAVWGCLKSACCQLVLIAGPANRLPQGANIRPKRSSPDRQNEHPVLSPHGGRSPNAHKTR